MQNIFSIEIMKGCVKKYKNINFLNIWEILSKFVEISRRFIKFLYFLIFSKFLLGK